MTNPSIPARAFGALLFDMDGTIVNSIPVVERVWTRWAERHGLDVAAFLQTIHGVQAIDTVRRLGLPGVDPAQEAADLLRDEMEDVDGIVAISGAGAFLRALPSDRWAIVTSAPRTLALRRLEAAGLPVPAVLVSGEDVARGKPAPDGFLLAAERLGRPIRTSLVFEDAPAGIDSAHAAGAAVAVVTGAHAHGRRDGLPWIEGYERLQVAIDAAGDLRLDLRHRPL